EVPVSSEVLDADRNVTFELADPDYTTASRVAEAINRQLGGGLAEARDANGVDIHVPPAARAHLVDFLAQVESGTVRPDRRAKVVINERTGTVVSGGDVRIDRVVISQGDLRISIATENTASQPLVLGDAPAGVRTAIVTNTRIDVDERSAPGF